MATNLIDSYMNNYHNSQTGKQQTSLGVSQISYSNSQQTVNTIKCSERVPSKDTVTIGNHKIKKRNLLVGLGAVTVATIGVVAAVRVRNANTLEKAQKTFQKVFLRDDISLEETKAILSRYKEIEKIENKEDYIQALFAEAKKNYGLEHTSVSCKIEDIGEYTLGASNGYGDITISKNAKRKGLINFIHHELRHTKQNDMMLSTNPEKYANGILSRGTSLEVLKKSSMYKKIQEIVKKQMPNGTPEEIEEMTIECIKMRYAQSLSVEAKAKGLGSKTYSDKHKDFVEKLFVAHEKYPSSAGIIGIIKYHNNFLEKDARFAGKNMEKVVKKTKLDN